MPSNEYLAWAAGAGANIEDHPTFAADPDLADGFAAGVARSVAANTIWRQTSVAVAALAQKIVDVTATSMLDDGSVANFKAGLSAMLDAVTVAAVDAAGSFGSGGIFGMITSNAVANPTRDITISTGQCRDSTNTKNIVLAAPITKRLDQVWAEGGGLGGRDLATALANGQTWHVFVILNPANGHVDALYSQSPTAPTLPAGFTKFRRIGSIVLDAAATTIRQYLQIGDWFRYKTRSADFAAQANAGAASLRSVAVPVGIKVEAEFYFQSNGTIDNNAYLSGLFDPDFGVPPAFGGSTQWAQVRRTAAQTPGGTQYCYGTLICRQYTDAAGHIYTFSNDGADVIALGVLGWRDDRGRFF
jgi:hypothetical protein